MTVTEFLTQCVELDPEDRASATELLQTPFIREAIAAGIIVEADPRLGAFTDALNQDTSQVEDLEMLAAIFQEER